MKTLLLTLTTLALIAPLTKAEEYDLKASIERGRNRANN